ncbi:HET-domain-containing protein [Polychaeton citri CBS 116435]|uniref:HET-domain-containing protein n=1 Tax=Polychaeton citri CBS 116435 TaxID=1314669 RepID=A0A9P4UPY1_9PEZI|nr:HET-domain-containing protein [Polychaeton citri CBS 116435]
MLRHGELDTEDPTEYETISYVWGDASERARIQIGGLEVNVPASSEAAIRRVRLHDQDRPVWIDAVCINQLDLAERGAQVAIMSRIYQQARCNLIHLGSDDNGAAESVLRALGNARKRVIDGSFTTSPSSRGRVWNIQEAVLASRNICYWGSSELPFEWIIDCNIWLTDLTNANPIELYSDKLLQQLLSAPTRRLVFIIRRLRETHERVAGLTSIRSALHDLEFKTLYMPLVGQQLPATDPRDHVFALAGLTALFHGLVDIPPGLRADYSKSPMEVYRDATRHIFQTSAWRIILYMINHRSQADITLDGKPSWTFLWNRTWSQADDERPLNHKFIPGLQFYDTDYRRLSNIDSSDKPQILTLHSCDNERESNMVTAMLMTTWPHDEGSTNHDLLNDEQLLEAYDAFLAHVTLRKAMPPPPEMHTSQTTRSTLLSSLYARMLYRSLRGRRFFSTHDGMRGLGPRKMQEGDVVAVTLGMAWPCILRPLGRMYQILGAAYIYGLTHGEVFGMGLEVQQIELC